MGQSLLEKTEWETQNRNEIASYLKANFQPGDQGILKGTLRSLWTHGDWMVTG
jgi:hypothetical protein